MSGDWSEAEERWIADGSDLTFQEWEARHQPGAVIPYSGRPEDAAAILAEDDFIRQRIGDALRQRLAAR